MPRILECGSNRGGVVTITPDTQNVRAGRLLLERIDELASQHSDFGFETTLFGRILLEAAE